ncbi:MAG: hypothetical protein RXO25_02930 [Caldivirga sp.]|jgi:hypothetical protein
MDVLVEVNPLNVKPEDTSGLWVTLNLVDYVKTKWGRSIPELAIELEDYEPVAIRVPTPRSVGNLVRLLELANYLNVNRVILNPPISGVVRFLRVAAEYNIVLSWIIKPGINIPTVPPPHRLSLTVNVPSFRGLRRLFEFVLPNLGSINFMYIHNVKGGKGGYPVMNGPIDYLKIVRILASLGWDGALVLSYRDEYVGSYKGDVNALRTFIESTGSTVLDKRTIKMLNSIMKRLMGGS